MEQSAELMPYSQELGDEQFVKSLSTADQGPQRSSGNPEGLPPHPAN